MGANNKFITTNNKTYVCGQNNCAQLGLGDTNDCPKLKEFPYEIKNITTRGFHSVGLSVKNPCCAYVWGSNICGQLGLESNSPVTIPRELVFQKKIKSVHSGSYHTIFLMCDGTFYSCGSNRNGELGLGTLRPKFILSENELSNVHDIYCGLNHNFALTNQGKFYAWGENNAGQLGLGHNSIVSKPCEFGLGSIFKLSCGGHNVAICTSGDVYAWGPGISGNPDYTYKNLKFYPKNLYLEQRMIDVVCGTRHSLFLEKSGKIFFMGQSYLMNSCMPVEIKFNETIKSIHCGDRHATFVTYSDTIYVLGDNQHGQLGLGDTKVVLSPRRLMLPQEINL